jgi:arsenate reductase (thioredoxin)
VSTESTVFFICLHGSAKSLIAMQYFNHIAAERGSSLRAVSAGTEPDDALPPDVIVGLSSDGFDVRHRTPVRATRELLARATTVVSFGPKIAALVSAGVPVEHWDDMPAVSEDYGIAHRHPCPGGSFI